MSKRFHLNQVVHIDTVHTEYGHICSDAVVKEIHKKFLFVRVKSLFESCINVPRVDVIPKVLDYDYYIEEFTAIVRRSNMLWRVVNQEILNALVRGKEHGLTLEEVAKQLKKSAGRRTKNEPACVMNFRNAAQSIAKGEELYLT